MKGRLAGHIAFASGGRVNRKWGRALRPQGLPAVTHFLQLRLSLKVLQSLKQQHQVRTERSKAQWETLGILITTEAFWG